MSGALSRKIVRLAVPATLILSLTAACSARDAAWERVRGECTRLFAAPALDPIRSKTVLDERDSMVSPPLAMLSDPSRPSAAEIGALRALDSRRRECHRLHDEVDRPAGHTVQARVKVSNALADLIAGTSTWGQFNRERAQAMADLIEAHDALKRAATSRSTAAPSSRSTTCYISGSPPFQTVTCN